MTPPRTVLRMHFRATLILGLNITAAFCFLRYVEWAFAYSATAGLVSRASQTQMANRLAWTFFCLFIVLNLFSAFAIGSSWESPDFGSAWLRFSARYGAALLFSLLAT